MLPFSRPRWQAGGVPTHAPLTTYILVGSLISAFCAFGTVLIFLPAWEWYIIPLVLFLPFTVILAVRWARHQRIRGELRATLNQLG